MHQHPKHAGLHSRTLVPANDNRPAAYIEEPPRELTVLYSDASPFALDVGDGEVDLIAPYLGDIIDTILRRS